MTADAVGGVWQYATELATALLPFGVETVIAVIGPAANLPIGAARPYRVVQTGLPLDWLVDRPAPVLEAGDAIAALTRQVGADIVQLNSPILAARVAFAVPVVAVTHGCVGTWWRACRGSAPDASHLWNMELTAAGLANADAIVAPSAAFAALVQSTYDLPVAPLVVHNGRTPLMLPDEIMPVDAVFTAGRLWDQVKNIALLDRVAAAIDAPFRAAGPLVGPQGETVAVAHLETPGSLDEAALARELAGRPIYATAATFEPFGLSVLEAAAAGCPLVLSNIDTFRELWTGAALLVAPDDEAGFVAAIQRIRSDPTLRAHLGEAAQLRAARYTPDAMATAMAEVYAGLTASRATEKVAA